MNKIEVNPQITNFVLFSGGGGLISREQLLALTAGTNQIVIREVPASFDPETLVIDFDQPNVNISEFVIKKPNRQYVDDNLKREGACAEKLIQNSVEIGNRRPEIIDVCESVMLRTYLDEEVYLVICLKTDKEISTKLTMSYFIDDTRFSWKPTITVELDENGETAMVKGFIAITNESAKRFENVEVSFADFAKDMGEDATNMRLEPKKFKEEMRKKRVRMMKLK
ncbi:hypothetical protein [Candidatus Uabimicrobium amorphum]|uniref:Uncharacterized protein n=1 Tax=Uabimicrobium amorphum TaxID=2596890 RepID=A0A5S9ISM4_UABAM|nr:hypothetical protein [Candidatus Uabimicrobium amorphum]BBM86681.1 hypothetical protein UABAM_05067 [Candidatus Uabimicrobium amorphum]